jgi:hypothetical protein
MGRCILLHRAARGFLLDGKSCRSTISLIRRISEQKISSKTWRIPYGLSLSEFDG